MHGILISDSGSNNTGAYTLQLERILPAPPAVPLDFNLPINDSISPSTDMDFHAFEAIAGNRVRITVLTTGQLDGRLELWDPNGIRIENTSCNAVGGGCVVSTDQTLTVSGTYLVGISDSGINNTGNYEISIQCVVGFCQQLTRAECDIQMSQATYVDGETVTADVFRFTNPTAAPIAVEWKGWLGVPGIPPIGIINLGADGSFVLPPGTDIDLGPLPLLEAAALPLGEHELSCRFLNPTTGRLLMEDRNFFDRQ